MDAAEGRRENHSSTLPSAYPAANASPTKRASSPRAKRKTLIRPPERDIVCISVRFREIGKQVERAGDEDGPPELPGPGERRRRLGHLLDLGEGRRPAPRPPPRAAHARSTSGSRSASAPPGRAARGSRRRPCRPGSRRRRRSRAGAASRSRSQSTASGVWAPSRTSPSRSSSRPARRDLHLGASSGGRDTPPPPSGRRRAAPRDRPRAARTPRRAARPRPLVRDRQLLARDLAAGLAEHLGVLEPHVRQQHDVRVEHVRRVEPAAEACFDDRDVDAARGEVGERRRGQHLELGRAERLGVGRARGAIACSNPRRPVSSRSPQPATCGEVYAALDASLRRAAAPRSCARRSTCPSCRRHAPRR